MGTNSVSWSFVVHSANGLGSNCETVQITKTGSYSKDSDECSVDDATLNDYASIEYVINECIQTQENESVILLCDDEKLYFNTYADSESCDGSVEQSVYHYFNDSDCYDIQCNASEDVDVDVLDDAIDDGEMVKEFIHRSMMLLMDKRSELMAQHEGVSMNWIKYGIMGGIIVFLLFGVTIVCCDCYLRQ